MSLFLVRMDHPDGDAWDRHVVEHLRYLRDLIDAGKLLASGPIVGINQRAGFLMFNGGSHEEIEALVQGDPFAREGLIATLRIEEWNPHFGLLDAYSSDQVPTEIKAIFAN